MDRKEFFRFSSRWLALKGIDVLEKSPLSKALENLETKSEKTERPPGASSSEVEFQKLCTGCDQCMIACPVNVIMVDDLEKRYPVIYPEKDPCIHCDGYPCIQSCPTGALTLT